MKNILVKKNIYNLMFFMIFIIFNNINNIKNNGGIICLHCV